VRIEGALNASLLEQSIDEIVRRHHALRTSFRMADGKPVQFIAPSLNLSFPIVDLTGLSEADRAETFRRLASEEADWPFDLTRGSLLKVSLLKLTAEDHMLLLTRRHIVIDDCSMEIFWRQLSILYEDFSNGQSRSLF
jgi:hypothetical protein